MFTRPKENTSVRVNLADTSPGAISRIRAYFQDRGISTGNVNTIQTPVKSDGTFVIRYHVHYELELLCDAETITGLFGKFTDQQVKTRWLGTFFTFPASHFGICTIEDYVTVPDALENLVRAIYVSNTTHISKRDEPRPSFIPEWYNPVVLY